MSTKMQSLDLLNDLLDPGFNSWTLLLLRLGGQAVILALDKVQTRALSVNYWHFKYQPIQECIPFEGTEQI